MSFDISWSEIGSGGAALLSLGWGALSQLQLAKTKKKQTEGKIDLANAELLKAKDALLETMRQEIEAWKGRYETEHAEYKQYRDETHEKGNRASETILSLTNENAVLRSRTDMTPVLRAQEDQGKILVQVSDTMTQITKATALILDRLEKPPRPEA